MTLAVMALGALVVAGAVVYVGLRVTLELALVQQSLHDLHRDLIKLRHDRP